LLTHDPAHVIGLTDRGTLAPGMRADINVIDLDALHLERPRLEHDLPTGAPRLLQSTRGYAATLVGGVVTLRNNEDTGARPGGLVRGTRN
jgi:N-acyl-D-aspartate/D-glutamate deacylase